MKKKSLAQSSNPTPTKSTARATSLQFDAPHSLECEIQHALALDSDVCLNSLVVRRTKNGVCLEGVLEFDDECPDICNRIKALTGVEEVINHLMMKKRMPLPPKG
ncbi:hypothetical protein [Gimesia fumaroli]|uniref:BON domain-containing protein n=1 Tax=Gimesia fumaroli TaxID=2527976 RepID=A0A518IBP4_9PLAN|nr:hypothetical protein [Gimesia fumaroli]QDV50521.1 hypothetical protein Enr17x_25620 [Gimesia fumaroli]